MFSGIGGFDLALTRQNHHCIGYSEINKYAIQIYEKNFGKEVKNYGDATKINPEQIPNFDLLCAGFPCQTFSIAGKRKGFQDTRGTLFFEIARILKTKKPPLFLLENVKGILNHDKGKTYAKIIQTLDELGYDFEWMVLNSKFFGVPQNRERVFIIGNLRETSRSEILPFSTINGENKEIQYYQKSERESARIYNPEGIAPTLHRKTGGWQDTKILAIPLKFLQRNQKKLQGEYSFTIDTANTGGVMQDSKVRRLSPTECERLQGFPDNWTEGLSDTERYNVLGNAITVNVVEEIIKKIGETKC